MYKKEQKLLKSAAERLRNHFCTSKAWSGQNSVKSMFLLKQPLWDGIAMTDVQKTDVKTEVSIKFGGKSDKTKYFK